MPPLVHRPICLRSVRYKDWVMIMIMIMMMMMMIRNGMLSNAVHDCGPNSFSRKNTQQVSFCTLC
jgi:hypothetical protein